MNITVVGAGVNGLTTAIELARAGHSVKIVAEKEPLDTTSSYAAAVWLPFEAEPKAEAARWGARSFARFRELIAEPEAGVSWIRGLWLFKKRQEDEPRHEPDGQNEDDWRKIVIDSEHKAPEQIYRKLQFVDSYTFTTIRIEMNIYLPYLEKTFLQVAKGPRNDVLKYGHRVSRESLNELFSESDVVVNCAGLGALELSEDPDHPQLYGLRGIVLRVERIPSISLDYFVVYTESPKELTYVVPRSNDYILGGTADKVKEVDLSHDYSFDPDDPYDRDAVGDIKKRCTALVPELAEVLADEQKITSGAALRPRGEKIRLESDPCFMQGSKLLIHNYGHGGSGVTLSWGCAERVVELVRA